MANPSVFCIIFGQIGPSFVPSSSSICVLLFFVSFINFWIPFNAIIIIQKHYFACETVNNIRIISGLHQDAAVQYILSLTIQEKA
jgi:hypothetical protein